MDTELKRCPFCGGKAVLITNICESTKYKGYKVFHSQFGCGFRGLETPLKDTKEEAINTWNSRVNMP